MYPAAILENTKTGRFHPIIFRPAPMPGGADDNASFQRWRSKGHHTEGFDNLDDARGYLAASDQFHDTGELLEWDGEDMPAMTILLPRNRLVAA